MRLSSGIAAGCCTLMVVLAFSAPASAQGRRGGGGFGGFGGGGGSEMMLLQSSQIQKELELVDDQIAKIKELAAAPRTGGGQRDESPEARSERRATAQKEQKAKLDAILLPQQQARLAEISLQVRGSSALNDADIQAKLGLTDDQKAQLKTIRDENRKAMGELFGGGRGQGGGDREANREKLQKAQAESTEKTLAVLTADQKAEFEKLQGKKIEIDRSALRGPGGPGGAGGRRGGQRRGEAAQ